MSELKTEELRTIAAQVGDVGGWRVAGLKIIWAANEIERLTRELEEERELHLTARSQSDAYEMGMESWKDGYERLMRELEAMEDARDIAQAEGALMEMSRDRLTRENERLEAKWRLEGDAYIEAKDEIERLTREFDHFKNSGIIEVAIRNPNVSSYMDHWEGRATKAEAGVDRLRAALERVARWNEHFEYAFSQDIMEFAREALQEPKP